MTMQVFDMDPGGVSPEDLTARSRLAGGVYGRTEPHVIGGVEDIGQPVADRRVIAARPLGRLLRGAFAVATKVEPRHCARRERHAKTSRTRPVLVVISPGHLTLDVAR